MRTRLGRHSYHMRHWLRLLQHSRSLLSYPLPMSMLTPGGIDHNIVLVNPVHKLPGTSSLVGDLLNLEINECVFSDLDCFLKLFPVLYMFKCPILIKVSAAVCVPPTLGVLHDIDYFWIFYPNIFYQAGKFANNAIEAINVGYVVSVNISDCFD